MYARNCTINQLKSAANAYGFALSADEESTRIRFTIRLGASSPKTYMKSTPDVFTGKRRKTNAVCLHGHLLFFRHLFEIAPEASVESSLYGRIKHTADTLEENYQRMRYMQIRDYDGLMIEDCCECPMKEE